MTPEQAHHAIPQIEAHVAWGLLAFPVMLAAGTKKPKYPGWQSKAWDLGILEAELRQPNVIGYGLTLPKSDPRRLVDLDLDDGKEGLQPGQLPWQDRLAAVEAEHGPLPVTKTTLTPSGGQHRWFLWPDDAPLPGGAWHGFTVRTLHGARNFVVGPGSISPVGSYVNPAIGTPVATMPADLAQSGTKARPVPLGGAITIHGPYQLPETIDHGACNAEVCSYTLSLWKRRPPLSVSEMWKLTLHELGPRLATAHTEEHLRQHFDRAVEPLPTKFPRDGYVSPDQSAGHPVPSGKATADLFRTGRQLVAETPQGWRYVAPPWLAIGTLTELDGKPKVAGKTTWALHLIRAVLEGASFLGEPTERSAVVLLTEQSRRSISPTLKALGLDRDDLAVLSWPDAFGMTWPEIVALALTEVDRLGARLLVVDTLGPVRRPSGRQ